MTYTSILGARQNQWPCTGTLQLSWLSSSKFFFFFTSSPEVLSTAVPEAEKAVPDKRLEFNRRITSWSNVRCQVGSPVRPLGAYISTNWSSSSTEHKARSSKEIRDLTKPRRRRERERQKTIGLLVHVHHAFLYISLSSLHKYDVKWPLEILSSLGNGNGKAIDSTISVRTWARFPLFSSSQNPLFVSNRAMWIGRVVQYTQTESDWRRPWTTRLTGSQFARDLVNIQQSIELRMERKICRQTDSIGSDEDCSPLHEFYIGFVKCQLREA